MNVSTDEQIMPLLVAIIGFVGVCVGAFLTAFLNVEREKNLRRLEFARTQIEHLYSPALGLRQEIKVLSELRSQIESHTRAAWTQICDEAKQHGNEHYRQTHTARSPEFEKIISYDNNQFELNLLPRYQRIIKLFQENMWLADHDTRIHYNALVRYVELWKRHLEESIPAEVLQSMALTESSLSPFYDHLQRRHDQIRAGVANGYIRRGKFSTT